MRLFQVEPARLTPNPANPRGDLGDLTELALSLKHNGMLQPVLAQPEPGGGLMLIDGHRRTAAAQRARLPKIPVLVVDETDVDVQMGRMCAAAMHKTLEPVELGFAFARLRDTFRLTPQQIAERTGYTVKTVRDRLLLTELPKQARRLVADGQVTAADGARLARDVKSGRGSVGVDKPKRWFTKDHRLAGDAKRRCMHDDRRQVINGVACGSCWEAAIRDDQDARSRASMRVA